MDHAFDVRYILRFEVEWLAFPWYGGYRDGCGA